MNGDIKVISFDADDTLWVNEPYYRETEQIFADLLKDYLSKDSINKKLFSTEMRNLKLYGYGAKGFMLSMIESAIKISENKLSNEVILKIIDLGKELLNKPLVLLDGVEKVLKSLEGRYTLIIATKGDLLDQERKLEKSGLASYFHHIEIMSDKKASNYDKLIKHLDIKAENFVMIGNSINSDIKPVLKLGSYAIHVPYHTTWIHEEGDGIKIENDKFAEVKTLSDVLNYFE